MDSATMALAQGTELDGGSIVVGEKIGQGGFGITYFAYDKKKKRDIVIKEFFPNTLVTRQVMGKDDVAVHVKPGNQAYFEKARRGFIREAKVLNELKRHPNIVCVYFFLEENNTVYYGMERLRGKDLRKYMGGRCVSAEQAYNLLLPVMSALEFCHAKGVLHRDISPDNIFMAEVTDAEGKKQIQPKLIDFGAAYVAIEMFTQTYPNVRKTGYSPYEQMMSGDYQGTWSDVYALCATFYTLLMGKPPVSAIDRSNGLPLVSPLEAGASISPEANAVLMDGLALYPRDRIQTVEEFRLRMGRALGLIAREQPVRRINSEEEKPGLPPQGPSDAGSMPGEPERKPARASAARHVAAYAADALVYGAAAALVQFGLENLLGYSFDMAEFVLLAAIWLFMLMFCGGLILTVLPVQATLGMLLTGLRLRCADGGNEAGVGGCVIYNLLRSVPVLGLVAELWLCPRLTGLCAVSARKADRSSDYSRSEDAESASNRGSEDRSDASGPDWSESDGRDGGGSRRVSRMQSEPQALLRCVEGDLKGKTYALHDGMTAGRGVDSSNIQIPVSDKTVSSRHCVFSSGKAGWILEDCSTNGTSVNGKRINHVSSGVLRDGTRIGIGKQQFIFEKR